MMLRPWLVLLLSLAAGALVVGPAEASASPDHQNSKRKLLGGDGSDGDGGASFQVKITCDQPGPQTSSALPLWTVDFGRALQEPNPLTLFLVSGVYRVDVVYQQMEGLLYVLGFVATRDAPVDLTLTIPAAVASDDAGATNAAAVAAITYQPPSSSAGWVADAGSAAFAGTMVLSFATGIMGGAGGGVGMGALGMANFAQTFYYSGTLPISNMPENYRAASGMFAWTSLATAPAVGSAASRPSPNAVSEAEDTLYSKQRFPYPPVAIVPLAAPSTGSGTVNASSGGATGSGSGSGSGSGGGSVPEQAVVVPIKLIEEQLIGSSGSSGGSSGGNVFQGPLPADGSAALPDGGGAVSGGGTSGASAGQPGEGTVQQEPLDGSASGLEGGTSGQPNPFDPQQLDERGYQDPPPEPDLPPAQQGGEGTGQTPSGQTPDGQTPTPTPAGQTPIPTPDGQTPTPTPAGQTPTPTPNGQTPTPTPAGQTPTPTPDGQTPTPTPAGQTPIPTPNGQTPTPTPAGQTPTPTPDGQTPTPTPAGQTPTPTPDGQTPTPTPAGQTPTPTPNPVGKPPTPTPNPVGKPPTPTPTPSPTPDGTPPSGAGGGGDSPPPPAGGIEIPGLPPGAIGGQDGGTGANYTEGGGPPQPPSPPQQGAPIYVRKRRPPPPSPKSSQAPGTGTGTGTGTGSRPPPASGGGNKGPAPPPPAGGITLPGSPPSGVISGQDGGTGANYTESGGPPQPPSPPQTDAPIYIRKRRPPPPSPPTPLLEEAPAPAPSFFDFEAPAPAPSSWAAPAPAPTLDPLQGPAPAPSQDSDGAPAPAPSGSGSGTVPAPAPEPLTGGPGTSTPLPAPPAAGPASAAGPSPAAGSASLPPSQAPSPAAAPVPAPLPGTPAPPPAADLLTPLCTPGRCPPPAATPAAAPSPSQQPTTAPAPAPQPAVAVSPPLPAGLLPPPSHPPPSPEPPSAPPPSHPPPSPEPPFPKPPKPSPPSPEPPSPKPPKPSPPSPEPPSPKPPKPLPPKPKPPSPRPPKPSPPKPKPPSPKPPKPSPPSPKPPSPKPPKPSPPSPKPPSPKPPKPSPPSPEPPSPKPPTPVAAAVQVQADTGAAGGRQAANPVDGGSAPQRRRLAAAQARSLIEGPLSSLTSSGFYVVTTVTVSDVVNGTTTSGQMQNVSDVDVGASALSRIRAIQSGAAGQDVARFHLQILWNVLFWSAVVIGGFAALHLALVLLLRWRKRSVPKMLHLPRLELLLFMMVLPMIVAAGATLLRGPGAGYITLGVLFAVLLPVTFLGVSFAFVVKYLARNAVDQRRAVFILQVPGGGSAAAAAGGGGGGGAAFEATEGSRPASVDMLARESGSDMALTQQFLTHSDSHGSSGGGGGARGCSSAHPAARSSGQFVVERQPGTSDVFISPGTHTNPERCSPRAPGTAAAAATAIGGGYSSRASSPPGPLRRVWLASQRYLMRPLFGFDLSGAQQASSASIPVGVGGGGGGGGSGSLSEQGQWLCKSKHDTAFVKRYGSLFEDARGPQVYRIRSVYDTAAADGMQEQHVGSGVLVPATYAWTDTTVQTLQTFGILLSVTKMVLFALVINSVGAVNNVAQILALVLVALLHLVYLRVCLPFRMRIELAAEMVASLCDVAVFVCGIILIAKQDWTTGGRHNMGIAMLVIQASGFLVFIGVRLLLAGRTVVLTAAPLVGDAFKGLRRGRASR